MIVVGAMFAFVLLVAVVLTFAYFWYRDVADFEEDEDAESPHVAVQLSRQHSALEHLGKELKDLKERVNDSAVNEIR